MDSALAAYDFAAQLTMLPPDASGRSAPPLFDGFRGAHMYLDGIRWMASYHLHDREILLPGETTIIYVSFIAPQWVTSKIETGRTFSLLIGNRAIAAGAITAVLNFDAHVAQGIRRDEQNAQS